MSANYLDAIRKFEGFTPQASWDYAQFTNGYGTKAKFAGEVIDKVEADRRFTAEIAEARAIVERHAPGAAEGTKAALTSLTFNAGDAWARSGLGDAVRNGDTERARDLFVQYNKAGGEVLPGLVKRRLAEVAWMDAPALQSMAPMVDAPVLREHGGNIFAAVAAADGGTPAGTPKLQAALARPHSQTDSASPATVRTPDFAVADPVSRIAADVVLDAAPGVDALEIATAASGFAGEARLTQLLLATRLIGSPSSQRDDDPHSRTV
jgi:lysozyme